MDFDIHQLDCMEFDAEGSDAAFEAYRETLLERFVQSPEGQERLKADPDVGFWAGDLIYYGYQYEGVTVPQMTAGNVRTIVTGLFPKKISLQSPEQADDAVPELVAFWSFLKREFQLPQADAILKFLRKVEPEFPRMMNDPANFGMAKSLFATGRTAGFDMTTQEGLDAFMVAFNSGQLARQSLPLPTIPPPSVFEPIRRLDPAARKAEKKKRKQAEAAKKRNRKRRK